MAEAIPEFGQKREHEERRDGGCGIIFDPAQRAFAVGKRELDGMLMLYGGGVSADEDIQEGVLREVREESGLHDFLRVEKVGSVLTHYRNNVKEVNRVAHATCFLMILQSADTLPLALEDHEKFALTWVPASEILEDWKSRNENEDYSHWIYFMENALGMLRELGYEPLET